MLKQSYGRERDWEEHFRYFLPFMIIARIESLILEKGMMDALMRAKHM